MGKKFQYFMIALNLLILFFLFLTPMVEAQNEIVNTLSGLFNTSSVNKGVATVITILIWLIIIAIVSGGIYYIWWTRQFKINIRGYDRSGTEELIPFLDTARLIIKPNQADMRLRKRKHANVIIADMKKLQHDVNLRKTIHIYKFGEVNDYAICEVKIVIPEKQELMEIQIPDKDNKGKFVKKTINVTKPLFQLIPTESQSREHSVRDLRDALAKLKNEDKRRDQTTIILYIIIGLTFIIGVAISSYYNFKASQNYLSGSSQMAEALKQGITLAGSIIQK